MVSILRETENARNSQIWDRISKRMIWNRGGRQPNAIQISDELNIDARSVIDFDTIFGASDLIDWQYTSTHCGFRKKQLRKTYPRSYGICDFQCIIIQTNHSKSSEHVEKDPSINPSLKFRKNSLSRRQAVVMEFAKMKSWKKIKT